MKIIVFGCVLFYLFHDENLDIYRLEPTVHKIPVSLSSLIEGQARAR